MSGQLSVGEDTWIGHEVLITGGDSAVKIGALCDIGPRVTFVTGSHKVIPFGPRVAGPGYSSEIAVGNGCWIGAGSIILGGSRIGDCTIIAAGAVVKGDFPSNCLIGGVPARVLSSTTSLGK